MIKENISGKCVKAISRDEFTTASYIRAGLRTRENLRLSSFFNPKTIAVIGASNTAGKVGNDLMLKLAEYSGEIIPINPSHDKVMGRKTYTSVLNYPGNIDLAVIAIPFNFVAETLEECGKKHISNVIVISAGFSEIGNIKDEEKIKKIAEKYKIEFIGPNCFGVTNPYLKLDLTFANKSTKPGKIGFISQSGALWSYISDLNIGISKFVSLGNQAGLGFSEFIEYFNKDKETKEIVLYMETLGENKGKKFLETCKNSKKPISVVKAGRSKQGQEAAISHTGSLATDFKIYQGAFKQACIKQFYSITQTFNIKSDIPQLIKEIKKIQNPKIAIVTNAGGAGAILTDILESNNIIVTEKPIDVIGTALERDYEKALKRLNQLKEPNTLLVILTPQTMSEPLNTAKMLVEFQKQNKESKKRIIACFLGEASIKSSKEFLEKNKIPCFTKCV